jgi:multidrug efflux pump
MSGISDPFIRRPIGTTLLSIGLFLLGMVAYFALPVASLPNVEFPAVRVSANRPGADPATMAASVASPLERALGSISGVNEITSFSSLGNTSIILIFDLNRNIDSAARDVQAALNAAVTDLPGDLPQLPSFRKANPTAQPVLILALTSNTIPPDQIFDVADTLVAQRISQVRGVAQVTINGSEQPAVRVSVDPARLASIGIGLDEVRNAIINANTYSQLGSFDGDSQSVMLASSGQLRELKDYENVIVRSRNGAVTRIGDIANVSRGVRNVRSAGWYNGKPAVLVQVTKQPDANVIDTVDGVRAILPQIQRLTPAGIDFNTMSDRTILIRASVNDLQRSLMVSIALVMVVVFIFLRRAAPTIAAGVTVPLSLAGAFICMWASRFGIDNLSLMAIIVSVGFVVDDAIVMIENVHRNVEAGMTPFEAALAGARQIGFTVISISLSLLAAFVPILFMPGVPGRMFREFSLTLAFAVAVSAIVSLSVTPMICGRFMKARQNDRVTWFDRLIERPLGGARDFYVRTLAAFMSMHWLLSVLVVVGSAALTIYLYVATPKGFFPQDDTGLLFGWTDSSPDISFPAMVDLQERATRIINADPAVLSTASFVGGGNGGSINSGNLYLGLKPGEKSAVVIPRLREKLALLPGIYVYLTPVQDFRMGGRQGRSNLQFTLWGSDAKELEDWSQRALEKLKTVPQLVDVATDRMREGLQATVDIDRKTAARLGVSITAIDNVLSNAYSQRQISTIYGDRNQYKVVLEVDPSRQRDPGDLSGLYVPAAGGVQTPLSAVAKIKRGIAPLTINHTGQFASITLTYSAKQGTPDDEANLAVQSAMGDLHLPETVHTDFAGDAKAIRDNASGQLWLIGAALLAVYIILGILYESLIHPLTIISTLPSAGLGAMLALWATGMEFTLVAFIGVIMLIGIVKKNGIMMVDFALAAERGHALAPREAILEACRERFRPILMTTLAAMCGAIPLIVATGAGSELRRPLGITIVGGLVLSQFLTLYTTPVIYLLMSRFQRKREPSRLQKISLAPLG